MAVSTNPRRTDTVLAAQRVIDMGKEVLLLQPDAAPLTVITKNIYNGGRKIAAKDPKFSWLEDDLESRVGTQSGGATSSATSVAVTDSTVFPLESLVLNTRTGEIVFVAASADATHITVNRGIGGTTAAAMLDADTLFVLASADEEDSTSPNARAQNPTQVDNYTQIFKRAVRASGSWLSSSNITSVHDWDFQRKKDAIEHLKDIELALLRGAPSSDAGSTGVAGTVGGARRTTGGVLNYTTQNNQNAGGTLTEANWELFMRTIFRYGGQKKVVFAAPLLISVLNNFSAGKLVTAVGDETYGVKVMNMVSPHGEVTLIKHNLLADLGSPYTGYGIAVDFAFGNVAYRYLNGDGPGPSRDTSVQTNIQTPDQDGRKDQWLTECGLQFGLPKAHGLLTGVTG